MARSDEICVCSYFRISAYSFPGGSHILTPTTFLDDVKTLTGDGNAGNDYE